MFYIFIFAYSVRNILVTEFSLCVKQILFDIGNIDKHFRINNQSIWKNFVIVWMRNIFESVILVGRSWIKVLMKIPDSFLLIYGNGFLFFFVLGLFFIVFDFFFFDFVFIKWAFENYLQRWTLFHFKNR